MTPEKRKLVFAVLFLVGALGLLGVQLRGLGGRSAGEAAIEEAPAAMMESAATERPTRRSVVWEPPSAGLASALVENPFLRPPGASSPRTASGGRSRSARRGLALSGIRMAEPPSVVINDRILRVGEAIAGWRVVSIDPDRVTLRSSDGKTIRLASSAIDAR